MFLAVLVPQRFIVGDYRLVTFLSPALIYTPIHAVSYLVVQVSPERMEKVSQLLLLLAFVAGSAVADCPAGQVTFAKKIHRCLSNYLAKCIPGACEQSFWSLRMRGPGMSAEVHNRIKKYQNVKKGLPSQNIHRSLLTRPARAPSSARTRLGMASTGAQRNARVQRQ